MMNNQEGLMLDAYCKTILTVIALALVAIVFQNSTGKVVAAGASCGDTFNPCYVRVKGGKIDVDEVRGSVHVFGSVRTN